MNRDVGVYRAEWAHPFIESERTVGEGERARTEFQTKKVASATFSISKKTCVRVLSPNVQPHETLAA